MDRREHLEKLLALGCCACMMPVSDLIADDMKTDATQSDEFKMLKARNEFVQNWLSDLLDSMEKVVDKETCVRIIEGCGVACFKKHKFKTDIAEKGRNNLAELLKAYSENFEIWRDGDVVHIRYGQVSKYCYCSAANYRPAKKHDLHCECTRMTHQSIFETALGRPFKVEILESLRRGGVTCHFAVSV